MPIVSNIHAPTTPVRGRRWASRIYSGDLAQTSRVRVDLATDLDRLVGLGEETSESMVLCLSEMFANACAHSRSGQDVEGRVVRTLYMPTVSRIQVAVVDDGMRTDAVEFQAPETPGSVGGGVGRCRARSRAEVTPSM